MMARKVDEQERLLAFMRTHTLRLAERACAGCFEHSLALAAACTPPQVPP